MTTILLCLFLWLLCGIGGAGFMVAHFNKGIGQAEFRDDLGTALLLAMVGGPFLLLIAFFCSGMGYHGWRLWRKKS